MRKQRSSRSAAMVLVEAMERRALLSASIGSGDTLQVVGKPFFNNVIQVTLQADVTNGVRSGLIKVNLNGTTTSFDAAKVKQIYVSGLQGSNTLKADGFVTTNSQLVDDASSGEMFPIFLDGGSGNDTISADLKQDMLIEAGGGAGNDSLHIAAAGSVTLAGGSGDDTMTAVNPTGDSNLGVLMLGYGGSDQLNLPGDGPVNATLFGGDGNDTFTNADSQANVTINGDGGVDTIALTSALADESNTTIDLNGVRHGNWLVEDGVEGEVENGVLHMIDNRIENVVGTYAGSSLNVIGNKSNNTINVTLPNGAATLHGGAGNDHLVVSDNLGASLFGDAGNDTLQGGNERDLLDGGAGSDNISGGGGTDTADYHTRTANLTIWLDGSRSSGQGGEFDHFDGTVEIVYGGSGNDYLVGTKGNNALFGNGGNDTIYGGGGVDAFFGGAGNDEIHSKNGNKDYVDGGAGTDKAVTDPVDTVINVETVTH